MTATSANANSMIKTSSVSSKGLFVPISS